jgi:hypothetical protein
MVKELELFHATTSDIFDRREELDLLKKEQNRSFVCNLIMHGSDISNACKPWKICMSWADLVLSEFFLQGDEEKRLGLPSLFDREKTNKPTSQVFFIEIFVLPFYKPLVKTFAPLWQLTDCLQANLQIWHLHRKAEVEMEDDKQQESNRKISGYSEELRELSQHAQTRSDYVVSKNDQLLRDSTKKLQAKTDPYGKLNLEPDIDLQPLSPVSPASSSSKLNGGQGRRRSVTKDRNAISAKNASNAQNPRNRNSHRSSQASSQGSREGLVRLLDSIDDHAEEDTILPLPSKLSGKAIEQVPLLIHQAPVEAGVGESPAVSDITSLQPGSPPPELPS